MLGLTGDDVQALQVLRIAEFSLLLLHQFDDPGHRLLDRFHMTGIAAGLEADLGVTDAIGLVEQPGCALRLVAARDQCIHAIDTDQCDGDGQRQNGGEAKGQFVADLERVHLSAFLDERKRALKGALRMAGNYSGGQLSPTIRA